MNGSAFSGSFFAYKLFFSVKIFAALSSMSPVDTFILTRFPAFADFLSFQTQVLSASTVSRPYTQECVSLIFLPALLSSHSLCGGAGVLISPDTQFNRSYSRACPPIFLSAFLHILSPFSILFNFLSPSPSSS